VKRKAGIDFGTVRIGVAISDQLGIIARGLPFVAAGSSLEESAERIYAALKPFLPLDCVVIGNPLHLNGKDSPMSLQVKELAPLLAKKLGTTSILWDERLTTAQVERTLKEAEMNRKKRAAVIDSLTAAAILQNYLNSYL